MSLIPPLPATGRVLPTKVVVRLLPPTLEDLVMPEEFSKAADWVKFVPGSRPENPSPENPQVNARLYVQFKTFQIASEFVTKFNGKVFSDDRGDNFRAVAAFAPFQRVPRKSKQLMNALDGTIESNEHFVSFIQNGPAKREEIGATGPLKKDAVAPLVAAIAERNQRLNEQIEQQRAAKANGTKGKAVAKNEPKAVEGAKEKPKKEGKGKRKKNGNDGTNAPKKTAPAPPPPPPPVTVAAEPVAPPKKVMAAPKVLMKRPAPPPQVKPRDSW
jgi:hypothetical protein